MDDSISRQAAIDALALTAREKFNLSDEFNHYLAGLMDGEMAIRQLPSVQPERKTGRWIEDSGNIACSICHTIWLHRRTNYCPNCGADMRGEEHD